MLPDDDKIDIDRANFANYNGAGDQTVEIRIGNVSRNEIESFMQTFIILFVGFVLFVVRFLTERGGLVFVFQFPQYVFANPVPQIPQRQGS